MHIEVLATLVGMLRSLCGIWHYRGGAGITAERAVSLTAREETEILLLDLGVELPGSPKL